MATERIDETTRLLRQREARSLSFFLFVSLVGFLVEAVILTVQVLSLPPEHVRVPTVAIYIVVGLAYPVALMLALRNPRWVGGVGLIVALLASTFAASAAYTMWQGFAADAPLAELAVRWPFASAGIVAIAGMALTLRPLYVVIAGTGAVVTLLGIHAIAALDPATVFVLGRSGRPPGFVISIPRLIAELIFVSGSTAFIAYAAHLARRTIREAVALQRTTDQLSRYFSPDVARRIRDGGEAFLKPGGREQDVVVLFSDLEGFTRACATLTPSESLALLSAYQERMVTEIFRAGGTLDKFTGDGIMATFGTPLPADDAADRAVRAARGMMAALDRLNEERARRGEAPFVQRLGLHAGPAIVGNVGTAERLEFTVIGDTVNVAARIQAAGKKTGRQAMVSGAVLARLSEPVASEPLGPVVLEGQPAPIELHALLPDSQPWPA